MENKICALIRQTWYETAKKNLQPADRLRFYELCFEYEFNGMVPDEDAPFGAKLLFDMVRHDIESDKAKALARAERARRNGANGGRPPKVPDMASEQVTTSNTTSETQQNPVGYTKSLYIDNNTQHNTTMHSESVDNEDTHTFFAVCLNFFERGCSQPVEEANTFWGYYESLGWKTKNGGDIVDRLALARAWRLRDCSKAAMRNRMAYADLMHKADPVEVFLIQDFVSMVRDAASETVKIVFEEQRSILVLEHKYMPALRQWIPRKADGSNYELTYSYIQQSLE